MRPPCPLVLLSSAQNRGRWQRSAGAAEHVGRFYAEMSKSAGGLATKISDAHSPAPKIGRGGAEVSMAIGPNGEAIASAMSSKDVAPPSLALVLAALRAEMADKSAN